MASSSQCSVRWRKLCTTMVERFIPPSACSTKRRTGLTACFPALCAALHAGCGCCGLCRGFFSGRASGSSWSAAGLPCSPPATRPCRALTPSSSGGNSGFTLWSACLGPRQGRPRTTIPGLGRDIPVCCSVCAFFAPCHTPVGSPPLVTDARRVPARPGSVERALATPLCSRAGCGPLETASSRRPRASRTKGARV